MIICSDLVISKLREKKGEHDTLGFVFFFCLFFFYFSKSFSLQNHGLVRWVFSVVRAVKKTKTKKKHELARVLVRTDVKNEKRRAKIQNLLLKKK